MISPGKSPATLEELAEWVRDARQHTIDLVADLPDDRLMGPRIPIINPLIWEIGHMAWFQEKWVLRDVCGEAPIRRDGDALYDSSAVPHDTRWDLPLPSRDETLAYMRAVRDRVVERLRRDEPSDLLLYHIIYSVFHEDMHTEAFTYTRQTLAYPAPRLLIAAEERAQGSAASKGSGASRAGPPPEEARGDQPGRAVPALNGAGGGALPGDAEIPGGTLMLGASPGEPFVFDNEKWGHPVEVKPFALARAPVTQAEFAAFADEGGYRSEKFWSEEGWTWRNAAAAERPVYWRCGPGGGWQRRDFDEWVPLEPHLPVIHVSWYEAEAYCRWAGRRLPTEAEWEVAAATEPAAGGRSFSDRKRRFPWGGEAPTSQRTNMDWGALGCIDVGALPDGDSAYGCRQMMGNVWEWTSTTFGPYPGFTPDPYKEYSAPWFGTRKVLRGGAWATRSRMLRNTWRNYFTPDRRDVLAGFRTCRSA